MKILWRTDGLIRKVEIIKQFELKNGEKYFRIRIKRVPEYIWDYLFISALDLIITEKDYEELKQLEIK